MLVNSEARTLPSNNTVLPCHKVRIKPSRKTDEEEGEEKDRRSRIQEQIRKRVRAYLLC